MQVLKIGGSIQVNYEPPPSIWDDLNKDYDCDGSCIFLHNEHPLHCVIDLEVESRTGLVKPGYRCPARSVDRE
jgi:hypothetical protein